MDFFILWIFRNFPDFASLFCEFFECIDEIFVKIATFLYFAILENKSSIHSKTSNEKKDFWYF